MDAGGGNVWGLARNVVPVQTAGSLLRIRSLSGGRAAYAGAHAYGTRWTVSQGGSSCRIAGKPARPGAGSTLRQAGGLCAGLCRLDISHARQSHSDLWICQFRRCGLRAGPLCGRASGPYAAAGAQCGLLRPAGDSGQGPVDSAGPAAYGAAQRS